MCLRTRTNSLHCLFEFICKHLLTHKSLFTTYCFHLNTSFFLLNYLYHSKSNSPSIKHLLYFNLTTILVFILSSQMLTVFLFDVVLFSKSHFSSRHFSRVLNGKRLQRSFIHPEQIEVTGKKSQKSKKNKTYTAYLLGCLNHSEWKRGS